MNKYTGDLRDIDAIKEHHEKQKTRPIEEILEEEHETDIHNEEETDLTMLVDEKGKKWKKIAKILKEK